MNTIHHNVKRSMRKSMKLLCAAFFILQSSFFISSCSDDNTGSMDLSGSCLVEKFVLDGKYEGVINTEKQQVKVKVPVDFNHKDAMEITSLAVSAGAKTNLKVGDRVNFDADRTLHITNGDLEMDYHATGLPRLPRVP